MEEEIWKQCEESVKCFYEISNMGRVKSITKVNKKEKIVKGNPNKNGYLHMRMNKTVAIHCLVAYAFIGPRPDGLQIDHIDRNSQNNRLDNLRYCTPAENMRNTKSFRNRRVKNRENGKIKISCDCGSITNKNNKSTHEKTEKHKKYLNSLL